jgi:hypothetical protein
MSTRICDVMASNSGQCDVRSELRAGRNGTAQNALATDRARQLRLLGHYLLLVEGPVSAYLRTQGTQRRDKTPPIPKELIPTSEGHEALKASRDFQTFRRNSQSPSSGSEIKLSKNRADRPFTGLNRLFCAFSPSRN